MRDRITIRDAKPADYDALLPIFLGLRQFSRDHHPAQPDDFNAVLDASHAYLHEILERGPESAAFVALTHDDVIAGYLIATIHEPNPLTSAGVVRTGSIDEIFIDERHRGIGAGNALMRSAYDWIRGQHAERVEVGAYAWNEEAIAFYARHGFSVYAVTMLREL